MPHRETADVQPKNSLLTGEKCRNAAKRFLFVSVEYDHRIRTVICAVQPTQKPKFCIIFRASVEIHS